MPTGYTAPIIDPKLNYGTQRFAIQALRAMGVAISLRDEPWEAQVPRQVEPETRYHEERLAAAKLELQVWIDTSLADKIVRIREIQDAKVRSAEEYRDQEEANNYRIEHVAQDIIDWRVPVELTNFKNFLLQQLHISLNNSNYAREQVEKLQAQTIEECLEEYEESLRYDVEYHTKEIARELERVAEHNKWLKLAWDAIDRLPASPWETEEKAANS